ncbi:TlyA family RNA methyltransferase [Pararhizobium haloflavum]|uniref:TlyA family RNA methyltransferase n=1 Tax=Pararhizobium haloflavum TaxID=2037914 RepID=UPI000C180812|nr:TlyA family RNA methyltransferase [Pararhizobium haloflavum]
MTHPGDVSTHDPDGRSARKRLDQYLVELGHFTSRSRARDAILRGAVKVDGVPASKPGLPTAPDAAVTVDDPAIDYVSRAALKLVAALDHFRLDAAGRVVLDIGASTGGFTQVALRRGACHVVAVDVGHGQLHPSLANDPQVTSIEGLNARGLERQHLGGRTIGCVVSDVSFISLKLALPPALGLAAPGAFCVLLVKPQFEAGRSAIGKGGLLRNREDGPAIAEALSIWLGQQPGWQSLGYIPSPVTGGDGNQEFLLAGTRT